jgi:hypothetical protein
MLIVGGTYLWFGKELLSRRSLRQGGPFLPFKACDYLQRRLTDAQIMEFVEAATDRDPQWNEIWEHDLTSQLGNSQEARAPWLLRMMRAHPNGLILNFGSAQLIELRRQDAAPLFLRGAVFLDITEAGSALARLGAPRQWAWAAFAAGEHAYPTPANTGKLPLDITESIRKFLRVKGVEGPPGEDVDAWRKALQEHAKGPWTDAPETVWREADRIVDLYAMLDEDCERLDKVRRAQEDPPLVPSALMAVKVGYVFDLYDHWGVKGPVVDRGDLDFLEKEVRGFHERVETYLKQDK